MMITSLKDLLESRRGKKRVRQPNESSIAIYLQIKTKWYKLLKQSFLPRIFPAAKQSFFFSYSISAASYKRLIHLCFVANASWLKSCLFSSPMVIISIIIIITIVYYYYYYYYYS